MPKLRIRQTRSAIGRQVSQKRTLKALGLKRINDVVEQEDKPEIRGMILKVMHLVEVESLESQGELHWFRF